MTEQQRRNAEALRAMFAAFERREFAAADRFLTSDCVIDGSTSPELDLRDQTLSARADALDRRFPEWRVRLLDVVPAVDGASLVAVMSSFMRRAGVSGGVATLSGGLYRFRDAHVCAVQAFPEIDAALRAAGLDPAAVTLDLDRASRSGA